MISANVSTYIPHLCLMMSNQILTQTIFTFIVIFNQKKICSKCWCYFLISVHYCKRLENIEHGYSFHVEGAIKDEVPNTNITCKNTPKDSCHYQCDVGYRLDSNPVLICEPNGTWSGTVPKCRGRYRYLLSTYNSKLLSYLLYDLTLMDFHGVCNCIYVCR